MNKLLMLTVVALLVGCETVGDEESRVSPGNYCQGAVEFYHTGKKHRDTYSVYFPSGEHRWVPKHMVETAERC